MALGNIAVSTNSFYEWIVRTNQLVVIANLLTEGQANSTGTLTLTNSGVVNGGVTLNVHSGLIKGDGGLVTNVRSSSLSVNSFSLVSNTIGIVVSGGTGAVLGSTIYLEVGALSESVTDASNTNIASALSVSQTYTHANAAYAAANAAVTDFSPAFDQANTALANADAAQVTADGSFAKANLAATFANDASTLSTGTVPPARVVGQYTSINAVGVIDQTLNVANTVKTTVGYQFPNGNTITNWTVSTADPSGGAEGDVWLKITA